METTFWIVFVVSLLGCSWCFSEHASNPFPSEPGQTRTRPPLADRVRDVVGGLGLVTALAIYWAWALGYLGGR